MPNTANIAAMIHFFITVSVIGQLVWAITPAVHRGGGNSGLLANPAKLFVVRGNEVEAVPKRTPATAPAAAPNGWQAPAQTPHAA